MPSPLSRRHALALLSGGVAMGWAGRAMTMERARRPFFMDGLSFLPEDLAQLSTAHLDGIICDISEIEEVRDANGTPRYLRTYAKCSAALDRVVARLRDSKAAYVALKGSDIGSRPGCAIFLQFQSCEPVGGRRLR